MVEKEYNELAKKYKLPSYAEINRIFQISTIEQTENLSVEIRRKIQEQIEPALEFVEHLIQPDPNVLSDMYECKYIDSDEKTHLLTIYKKLMKTLRANLELDLLDDEKEDCHFIASFTKEWQQLKQEILPFIVKIKTSWTEPTESREKLEYLG